MTNHESEKSRRSFHSGSSTQGGVMRRFFIRPLSLFVAIQFLSLQIIPVSWGASKKEVFDPNRVSVTVVTLPSSSKDAALLEPTAEAIRADLKKIRYFQVVNPATASLIANYHSEKITKNSSISEAEKYLGLSKTHWFDRQYAEAEATVNRAIQLFRRQPAQGELLVDALLTKALILQELNRSQESSAVFAEILKIDPNATLEGLPVASRTRRLFNQAKNAASARNLGSLEVKSDPPASSIYINGVKKGVTPLTLKDLPQGSYLLTLEASNYSTVSVPVVVTANTTQFINRKLKWKGASTEKLGKNLGVPAKTPEMVQDEIKQAAKLGSTLKVDRVILVSSEQRKGKEHVVVRTIDTALQAGYNPIAVPADEFLRDKNKAIQKIASAIDHQARTRVLDDPAKYLEPKTGKVDVLRHRKPFYKKPAFYAITSAVVGGIIAAVILATQSSSDSGTGTVEVPLDGFLRQGR